MRLTRLTVDENPFTSYGDGENPRFGEVTFESAFGRLILKLTKEDIEDIEQLLRAKTKVLAQEA